MFRDEYPKKKEANLKAAAVAGNERILSEITKLENIYLRQEKTKQKRKKEENYYERLSRPESRYFILLFILLKSLFFPFFSSRRIFIRSRVGERKLRKLFPPRRAFLTSRRMGKLRQIAFWTRLLSDLEVALPFRILLRLATVGGK